MNSDSYEYINAQQLTDSGGYAHISSTSNNTVVAAHKPGNGLIDFLMRTSHRLLSMKSNISQGALTSNDQLNRFKRGCREHAVNIGRDDPLAIFINSRSLQQVKSLLNVIRMSRDEDLPLTGVKLALYDHDIQVNLDQLARLMNDDLQRWAFGLINDEELDDAYFGNSPHHEPSLHFCDKIRTYRLVISIVLFVICFLVILATSAFIYRCANMRATKLEMERNIVPLDQLTCQENISTICFTYTDITFITVQRGHALRYFTYV
uniref:Uncharacterized protein n=1 Tax=Parascaris univalens TaxID=6257 RepID=A0A915BUC1_PARUN